MLNKIKNKRYLGIIDSLLEDYITKYQGECDKLEELQESTIEWVVGDNIINQVDKVNGLCDKVKFLGQIRDELENNTFTKDIESKILECI